MRTMLASLVLIAALSAACPKNTGNSGTSQQPVTASDDAGATAGSGGDTNAKAEEEACVDAYLASKNLDKYGHPDGTMYMGGTPLFDERTGERKDRLEYGYSRQPEAKAKCHK